MAKRFDSESDANDFIAKYKLSDCTVVPSPSTVLDEDDESGAAMESKIILISDLKMFKESTANTNIKFGIKGIKMVGNTKVHEVKASGKASEMKKIRGIFEAGEDMSQHVKVGDLIENVDKYGQRIREIAGGRAYTDGYNAALSDLEISKNQRGGPVADADWDEDSNHNYWNAKDYKYNR